MLAYPIAPLFPLGRGADSIGPTGDSLRWQLSGPVVPAIPTGHAEAICRVLCFHREPDQPHDARGECGWCGTI